MPDLQPVYDELLTRLRVHEDAFEASHDFGAAAAKGVRSTSVASPDTYVLLGAPSETYPGGISFAGLRLGRRYVSYYLMSVHTEPGQLDGISPELRKRMQGKGCFNFTRVDEALFDELADLTMRGREQYARAGWLRD